MSSSIDSLLPLLARLAPAAMMSGAFGGLMGGGGDSAAGASLGPSGMPGSASLFGAGAGMGSPQLPGAPAAPSGMPSQFSMPAGVGPSAMSPQMMQAAMMAMQQGQPQQQGQAAPMPQQVAFGNPAVRATNIGPAMPYLSVPGSQPFGFGGGVRYV
jgi:hypothetical protein